MSRPARATRRPGIRVFAHAALLAALSFAGALPAVAAVSPHPPIPLGNVTVGTQIQADVTVPLSIPFTSIPASYDASVVFTSANALQDTLLGAIGLSSPVTIGQIKAAYPAWVVTFPAPTPALDNPSGAYSLVTLGCDAVQCVYRATFAPTAQGVFTAQLAITVAGITIVDGGLLGTLLNLFLPFTLGVINATLVYDFTGTGVPLAVVGGPQATAVPGPDGQALLALAALVAAAGMAAIARRRRTDLRAGRADASR